MIFYLTDNSATKSVSEPTECGSISWWNSTYELIIVFLKWINFVFLGVGLAGINMMSDEEAQEHFDNFFEDVFIELEDKYGEIEEMNVCDNLGDHLVGNVYVKVSAVHPAIC